MVLSFVKKNEIFSQANELYIVEEQKLESK